MNPIKLDLNSLFNQEGGSLAEEGAVDLSGQKLWGRHPFGCSVTVKAAAHNHAGVVTLNLSAQFEQELVCDRCLGSFTREFSPSFEHVVVQRIYGEDDGTLLEVPDGKVDVDELFACDLLLESPTKVLCREDCRGLCPKCGHDLNQGDCGCDRREPDPRLSGLDSFYN